MAYVELIPSHDPKLYIHIKVYSLNDIQCTVYKINELNVDVFTTV